MSVFWPGLIAGLVLVIVCIIAYRKREALAANMGKGYEPILGRKAAEKFKGICRSEAGQSLDSNFHGHCMGGAIIILSVTGVMR